VLRLLTIASIALQSTDLPIPVQPEYRHYVVDSAQILDVYSESVIDSIGERLNADGRPLYVVTIDAVPGDSNERYRLYATASAIYAAWKIGANHPPGAPGNRGALLLLARGNQQSVIVFGAGWAGLRDAEGMRLTRDVFDPALATAAPGDAIVAGVQKLAGALEVPNARIRWRLLWFPAIAILLGVLSFARIHRRNARRAAASDAQLEMLALQLSTRQNNSLRVAEGNVSRRVSPLDPPS
jgi:uncharacterized membrane protein YgcG